MKINNINIQLLNEKVDKIVLQKNQNVYYLIDDILYKYDQIGGHKKILQYKRAVFIIIKRQRIYIKKGFFKETYIFYGKSAPLCEVFP